MDRERETRPVSEWPALERLSSDVVEFRLLWLVAAATYGVGDIVTTVALVGYVPGVVEANAVVRVAMESQGLWGLTAVKLAAFAGSVGVAVYGAHARDRVLYYLPPVSLTLVGAFATAYNLRLMLG